MGHDVIRCPRCGAWVMEGHNDWECDDCGWYLNQSVPDNPPSSNLLEIKVMSRNRAARECPLIDQPFLHISIYQDDESELQPYENDNLFQLLKLKFYDIDKWMGEQYPVFDCGHAKQIRKAVERFLESKGKLIVVNCEAGISRSAAVAKALSEYYQASKLVAETLEFYNRYVYRLLMEFLHSKGREALDLCQRYCHNQTCGCFRCKGPASESPNCEFFADSCRLV